MKAVDRLSRQNESPISAPAEVLQELLHIRGHARNMEQRLQALEEYGNRITVAQGNEAMILRTTGTQSKKWVTNVDLSIFGIRHNHVPAIFDSGSDFNCIRPFHRKECCEKPHAVNGTQVIKCGQKLKADFIILTGIEHGVLLGNPFLTAIQPITVDQHGVS